MVFLWELVRDAIIKIGFKSQERTNLMAHKKIPLEHDRKIALVAHDNKKWDLAEWSKFNRDLLAHHQDFGRFNAARAYFVSEYRRDP